jgi:deferrochelatase/peroxidase EfeB
MRSFGTTGERTPRGDEGPNDRRRRNLLLGLGVVGGALGLGAKPSSAALSPEPAPAPSYFGPNQAGVTTSQQNSALVVAFDVLADTRDDLAQMFSTLGERIRRLMKGETPPDRDPRFPPPDSGLLGGQPGASDLTITVAVGASLFDQRYGLAGIRPRHLEAMTGFPNDALDPKLCHGDLLVQICSSDPQTNIHALRDFLKNLPAHLTPRWRMEGFVAPRTDRDGRPQTSRNLLGFKDGTANPEIADAGLMRDLVWVGDRSDEPAWTIGGSYQVVRIIRATVERWDRTPLGEQQEIIGRNKISGAPLGEKAEFDTPRFSAKPAKGEVPANAHIRLANPRQPQTEANRILRRGYSFSQGLTAAGQLDMGLMFICFQADLSAGFFAVQARLNGEPLEEYIKPIGGGYFFVLPGVRDENDRLGAALLRASA